MMQDHVANPDHTAADHMALLAKINREIAVARRADQSRSLDLFDCRETWARAPSSRHLV
jgi:hypothetical protein